MSDLLHITPDFLTENEKSYWENLMRSPQFWSGATQCNETLVENVDPKRMKIIDPDLPENEMLLVEKIRHFINETYEDEFVTTISPNLEKCLPGFQMGLHSDHTTRFGEVDLEFIGPGLPRAFHDVVSILYFNDIYNGGQLFFPHLGIHLSPRAGTLVTFPCVYKYEHGVTKLSGSIPRFRSSYFWMRKKTLQLVAAFNPEDIKSRIKNTIRFPDRIKEEEQE